MRRFVEALAVVRPGGGSLGAVVLGAMMLLGNAPGVRAQATEAERVAEMIPTLLSNSITNLHTEGDTLWTGPFLNYTFDGGQTWLDAPTDSLFGTRNRVFSLDVEGPVIWAGLGFNDASSGDVVQAAGGFLVSTDGGHSFTYRFPQLDVPGDTLVQYGVSTLWALDVVVPQQSPPFDIDYDPVRDEVWVAGWASGLRRSDDGGRTWQRVVLPPDDLEAIYPDSTYTFTLEPQRGGQGNLNHMAFAVLVDETGTVWAGTPRGVNRSTDGGLSWQRFSAGGTKNSLPGSWVVSIEEQPLEGRNPIWMATWNAGEVGETQAFGVAVTRDGGATYEQKLIGVQAIDFAFDGQKVYVAGRERGLFVSEDGGTTWQSIIDFRDQNDPDRVVRPGVDVLAVATGPGTLWVGTDDGLLKSTDGGQTWTVFRVEVPLNPETPTATVPRVSTFAYPNPFSPSADRFVRIRYEVDRPVSATVRVFDFGMNLVRELRREATGEGIQEIRWDGTDRDGLRVANGAYFYAVEAGGQTFRGKILVIE